MSFNKMTRHKMKLHKMSFDKMTRHKMTLYKMSLEKWHFETDLTFSTE